MFNFMYKFIFPTPMVMHFETTKGILVHRLFTNDMISFQTSPDYYLTPSAAHKALRSLIQQIMNDIAEGKYYQDDKFEKMKNALAFSTGEGIQKEVPWFLK